MASVELKDFARRLGAFAPALAAALIGALALFFHPIALFAPSAIYFGFARSGLGGGALALASMFGAIGLISGSLGASMVFTLTIGAIGATLALLNARSTPMAALSAALAALAALGIGAGAAEYFASADSEQSVVFNRAEIAAAVVDEMLTELQRSENAAEAMEIFDTARAKTERFITIALPSIVFISLLFAASLTIFFINSIAARLKIPTRLEYRFAEFRAPTEIVWLLIASGATPFLIDGYVESLALNLFLISIAVLYAQGFSVVVFFLERWNSNVFLKFLAYYLLCVNFFVAFIGAVFGLVEILFDIRKRFGPRAQSAPEDRARRG